jgi:hypothetical protein
MGFAGNVEALSKPKGIEGAALKRREEVIKGLQSEAGLSPQEAGAYLKILEEGAVPASPPLEHVPKLQEKGMVILSGDGKRIIPVHPRLGVANQYRVWREALVREINERRMRVDRLILELIPVYEAAREKRAGGGSG